MTNDKYQINDQNPNDKSRSCIFLFSFVIWIFASIYLSFDHLDFEFEQGELFLLVIFLSFK